MNEQEGERVHLWTKDFIRIALLNLMIFLSFQMLQPTLPLYIKQLGGESPIVGLIAGVFTISSLIARPFTGMALDRIGRRAVFLFGLGVFIIAVLAYQWIPIIGAIIALRLIHGLGWGACSTASNTIASDCIPKERFGEGMGYFSLASSIAMATAPAVGLHLTSKYGFHTLFLISAGIIGCVFLLAFTLKNHPIDKAGNTKTRASLYEKASVRPAIVIFFVSMTYGAITSFIALYAQQQGIEKIGLFFTLYALALILSRPAFGSIYDRLGDQYAVIPGLVCLLISLVLLSKASVLPMFLISAFLYGIGFGAVQSTLQTMAVVSIPPGRRGAANATFFTGFDSGIGLGAMIFGAVASLVGYSRMYLWGAASILIACVLYFVVLRKREASDKE
ncbi:MAG: MFS transporter [Clostridia bacterium]|nr:MFS transporter [Clostridia bacterium]